MDWAREPIGHTPVQVKAPAFHWLLHAWDEQVQAAIKIQTVFRRLKRQSEVVGWPSSENPYHWVHFVDIRKKIGWSTEELYDEFGHARVRTDGGRAPTKSPVPASSDCIMKPIGNFRNKQHKEAVGADAWPVIVKQEASTQVMNISKISQYLADRWWTARQEALKQKLLQQPLRDTFKHGSEEYERLMAWMLDNGHSTPITLQNPHLWELKASISFRKEEHQNKIMNLLGMFHNVLQLKQGNKGKRMEVNREAVSMYEWAIKDASNKLRDELEECRRWCSTPPEIPEGFEPDLHELHQQVCKAMVTSTHRVCRLRKTGRDWLQAFEDSARKRRRLVRTRSAGNLGLLGPPSIDPSTTKVILPLVGEPLNEGGSKGQLRHWVHVSIQKTLAHQKTRKETGRDRPLRCINTEWMGGVDWRAIEAKATGFPYPNGPQFLPAPTDEELGDLFENVLKPSKPKWAAEVSLNDVGEDGDDNSEDANSTEDATTQTRRSKNLQEQLEHELVLFETWRYTEEVHDVLKESGLTGQHCKGVLQQLMSALRAPKLLPPCDSGASAQGVDLWLRAQHKPKKAHQQIPVHNEHAAVGSEGQDQALHQIKWEQGECVPTRSLSCMLPSEIGRAIESAYQQPKLPKLPKAPLSVNKPLTGPRNAAASAVAAGPAPEQDERTDIEDENIHATKDWKPEITWPMMQRAWQQAGLPGWQGCDARTLYLTLDCQENYSLCGQSSSKLSHKDGSLSLTPTLQARHCTISSSLKHPWISGLSSPSAELLKCMPTSSSTASASSPGCPRSAFLSTSGRTCSSAASGEAPSALQCARALVEERKRQALETAQVKQFKDANMHIVKRDWSNCAYSSFSKEMDNALIPEETSGKLTSRDDAGAEKEDHDGVGGCDGDNIDDDDYDGGDDDDDDDDGASYVGLQDEHSPGPPTSDMLFMRRKEFWATIIADAHIMQLHAEMQPHKATSVRARRSFPHLRRQCLVRERRKYEEEVLMNAYLNHYKETQQKIGKKPVRVSPLEISAIAPLARKHMQLDWCTLFKSEMYKWLNRYLCMGKLPTLGAYSKPGSACTVRAGGGMEGKKGGDHIRTARVQDVQAPDVGKPASHESNVQPKLPELIRNMSTVRRQPLRASRDVPPQFPPSLVCGNGSDGSISSAGSQAQNPGPPAGAAPMAADHIARLEQSAFSQHRQSLDLSSSPRCIPTSRLRASTAYSMPAETVANVFDDDGADRLSKGFVGSKSLAFSSNLYCLLRSRSRDTNSTLVKAADALGKESYGQELDREGSCSAPANVQTQRLARRSSALTPRPPTEPPSREQALFARPLPSQSRSNHNVHEPSSNSNVSHFSSRTTDCIGSVSKRTTRGSLEGYLDSSTLLGRQESSTDPAPAPATPLQPKLQGLWGQQQRQQQQDFLPHRPLCAPAVHNQRATAAQLSRENSLSSYDASFANSPLISPLRRPLSRHLVPTRVPLDAACLPRFGSCNRQFSPMSCRASLEVSRPLQTGSSSSSLSVTLHGTSVTSMAMMEGKRSSRSIRSRRFSACGPSKTVIDKHMADEVTAGTMRDVKRGSMNCEGDLSSLGIGLSIPGRRPSRTDT